MQRGHLDDLLAFLAVPREQSFTRAAAKIGVSQSALSHTMRELEARLGVRLLTRTTRRLGWTEGQSVAIEYRWGEGRTERFAEIADEFVRLKVDVILTHNTPPTIAAKQATSVIPIVFATAGDPSRQRHCGKSGATGRQYHRLVRPGTRYGRQADRTLA